MRSTSCAALLSLVTSATAATHELIVGTFFTPSLYTIVFDDEALTLDLVANTSVPGSSAWIALSHDKKNLYGTDFNVEPPAFFSYALDNASSITHEATVLAGGNCTSTPIFVVADDKAPYDVYGTFFGDNGGCGSVMSVDDSGTLQATVQNYTYFNESGVHGTALSPDSTFLYSADDTGNTLWTHAVDRKTGEVTYVANLTGPATGSDPRHVAVHPNGKYLYVVLEGTSQLAQYIVEDASTGVPSFTNVTYPLLAAGEDAADFWADEVAVSPSRQYLWATNRARNDNQTGYISAFDLDAATGAIAKQNFLLPTNGTGGTANSVAPAPFADRFVALTDSSVGFVEIWELAANGSKASAVAHLDLLDGGCCANAVWYS